MSDPSAAGLEPPLSPQASPAVSGRISEVVYELLRRAPCNRARLAAMTRQLRTICRPTQTLARGGLDFRRLSAFRRTRWNTHRVAPAPRPLASLVPATADRSRLHLYRPAWSRRQSTTTSSASPPAHRRRTSRSRIERYASRPLLSNFANRIGHRRRHTTGNCATLYASSMGTVLRG